MFMQKKTEQPENKEMKENKSNEIITKSFNLVGSTTDFTKSNISVGSMIPYRFFENVPPLNNAITRIAKAASSVSIGVVTNEIDENGNKVPSFDYENEYTDLITKKLIEENIYSLLLDGNIFNIINANNMNDIPSSIEVIQPFNVSRNNINFGSSLPETLNVIQNQRQSNYSRTKDNRYIPNTVKKELIFYTGSKTLDDWRACSPVNAIYEECLLRYYASQFNKSFLEKSAHLSGILTTDDLEEYTEDQQKQIQDELQLFASGYNNAGAWLALLGVKGLKFTPLGKNPKDMNYSELIESTNQAIAANYHIPLPMISGRNQTLSNVDSSNVIFWESVIIPNLEKILNFLTLALRQRGLGENQYLGIDIESIEALAQRRAENAKIMSSINAFTINEIRASMGYPSIDGGDQIISNSNVISLENIIDEDASQDDELGGGDDV